MPRHRPGEQAVLQFLIGGCAFGDDLEIVQRNRPAIARLDQHPARDCLHRKPAAPGIGQRAAFKQAQVLLSGEDFACPGAHRRCDHHLGEDPRNRFGGRAVELGIDRDNPAKCRNAITRQRRFPSLQQRAALRHAAGVGVFDDNDGGRAACKLRRQFQCGIGVVEVVVAQFLALQLRRLRHAARAHHLRDIDRGGLVRVFAITQRVGALEGERQGCREQRRFVARGG